MSGQIQLVIEKLNHGNWLKVVIPYSTNYHMSAVVQSTNGIILKKASLLAGNNLIDIESIKRQVVHIKIDTPYETLLREVYLE